MPSFFPGAQEQDAAAMALPARVCGGTSLSSAFCRLVPPLVSLSRQGTLCQGAYLLCWGLFTLLGMFVVILCNILVVSEFGWNLDKKTQKQISTAESAST